MRAERPGTLRTFVVCPGIQYGQGKHYTDVRHVTLLVGLTCSTTRVHDAAASTTCLAGETA